ncbi:hypothetical protein CMQ_2191 [Grosmannia clavigera kw1407]|uniref:DUF8004 domain-containing protein n=1 Tax=Grosmannia clavigera (strain kw1407 / UAMH 11150) TaxID=655863 RepID=F0XJS6_GROCL|nr:uncharacterized protein CMQ_2191 [Grosmannia clavigera kw1407]EFX02142.1 hypothetical protein CMQ_2191 [Grosmannia clavigera kw1407]
MSRLQAATYSAVANGGSGRPRGRMTGKAGDFAESHQAQSTGIKRWDGKARTSQDWDCLRQDPDLWFRNGNCHVHLYGKGQSRRGPVFKVPFSTLLAAQCHPLVERFIAPDVPTVPEASEASDCGNDRRASLATLDYWARIRRVGRVDLYIPPPVGADLDQILSHHVAMRNLFAWIFRRPLVGEHLGPVLTSLLDAMRDFRSADSDNVHDLLVYIDEAGYLQLTGQPDYAMGVLQLAEATQNRVLYIDAFSHCVGMYNRLYLRSEYSHISPTSRRLIRRARLEMDMRLGAAGKMLKNFLDEELSETYLGLTTAARAHLDRFRTYILGYYTTRLGYYPPSSMDVRSTIFEPHILRSLTGDFQALYDYLVDEEYTIASDSPTLAHGGVCVLQSVESFDERHKFPTRAHPLPLLPQIPSAAMASGNGSGMGGGANGNVIGRRNRMAWFSGRTIDKLMQSRSEKLRPSKRLLAHAALLRATTQTERPELSQNELVWAYRRFEEESVLSPVKADRGEKISMVDARKVRWIFIYAVHQALQNHYLPPPAEVRDAGDVPYHISISTANLPPWQDSDAGKKAASPVSRRLTIMSTWPHLADGADMEDGSSSDRFGPSTLLPSTPGVSTPGMTDEEEQRPPTPEFSFDIRPDIDYLGLANRHETGGWTENSSHASSSSYQHQVEVLPRTRSLTSNLSRNAAIRRSLVLFRSNSTRPRSGIMVVDEQKGAGDNSIWPESEQQQQRQVRPISRSHARSPYHEILVHGYGNGTNPVCITPYSSVDGRQSGGSDGVVSPTTARTLSTASTNSTNSNASDSSAESAKSVESAATTISNNSGKSSFRQRAPPPLTLPVAKSRPSTATPSPRATGFRSVSSPLTPRAPMSTTRSPVAARSSARPSHRRFSVYGGGDEYAMMRTRRNSDASLRASRRSSTMVPAVPKMPSLRQYRVLWNERPHSSQEMLLAIRESRESLQTGYAVVPAAPTSPKLPGPSAPPSRAVNSAGDVQPEWEKFSAGLGGHTVLP